MQIFKSIIFYFIFVVFCSPLYGQFTSHKEGGGLDTSYYYVILKNKVTLFGKKGKLSSEYVSFEDLFLGKVEVNTKNIEDIEMVTPEEFFLISTKNSNSFSGHIMSINKSFLKIDVLQLGIIDVPFETIKSITHVERQSSKYEFINPHPTRYFFSPSAIPLKKKTGYFQNLFFFFNGVQYGVTDNFSIGGGIIIPFLIYITPKFGYRVSDRFYLGGGALISSFGIFNPNNNRFNAFGILYGTATYGNNENNISVNLGWGGSTFSSTSSAWEWARYPTVSLSGMMRLSTRFALVSENWFFNFGGDNSVRSVFSFGARALWGEHSIDFFGVSLPIEASPILPGVSYVFKFK